MIIGNKESSLKPTWKGTIITEPVSGRVSKMVPQRCLTSFPGICTFSITFVINFYMVS
jgi:hypothetical protein